MLLPRLTSPVSQEEPALCPSPKPKGVNHVNMGASTRTIVMPAGPLGPQVHTTNQGNWPGWDTPSAQEGSHKSEEREQTHRIAPLCLPDQLIQSS